MSGAAVKSEQIRTLFRQSVPILLANAIVGAILCVALWPSGPRVRLLVWMAAMALLTLARVQLRRRYWRDRPAAADAAPWGRGFMLGSASAGVLWGVACFLFYDGNASMAQLLVSFAVGGMTAGAAGTLASYMPAFRSFVYPSLGLLVVRTVAIGGPHHLAMAGMLVVYGLAMAVAARNANRQISDAFRLRFENEDLLARLSEAQSSLQETNRSLEQRVNERTAALERQAEALREAQRLESVGRLAAGIAHDFNNLLTVVLANATLLLRDRRLEPSTANAVEEMKTAASRGADLVRQLLAFGRQQRLAGQVLDLNAVVASLGPLLARLIGEQVRITMALAPGKAYVKADRSQIEQVIVNLVTNARDAMPSGGQLAIETALITDDPAIKPCVVLSVSDSGLGMDRETRQRVFEPFFTTKPFGKGTGLGLATVHGVVEQSGGRVVVDSEPGVGSCFKVFLPLTSEVETPDEVSSAGAARGGRGTILLAEDDVDVRVVIERVLREAGHQVIAASGGIEALARSRAHEGTIHLLVSDVVMPDLGGAELAKRLIAERPGLRVLFVSGYIPEGNLLPETPNQIVEYLAKPVTSERLQRKVATLLDPLLQPVGAASAETQAPKTA
ncbi:MAG TPA: ATP-binding protein [Polyangia bacterium]|jgi:signal transduction histidine kinase/ActR/RegA family two-component response regulator|nr:ATP-binding protein [Polyangia bacterium]